VPTPVGPAPRDPNDPDFWDWGHDDEDRHVAPTHTLRAVVAVVVAVALALLIVFGSR
jgi:hypothetical protein